MVQFKDCFLGKDKRDYVRAVSSQRCVRAGGKHNDLENVGYTARHHTFFEMLGNFSFGDYFKKDAIRFALGLRHRARCRSTPRASWSRCTPPTTKPSTSGTRKSALPTDKIVRIGDKPGGGSDNFWQMGDTGPCGPCTEIFFDHGAHIPGGPPGSPDADGDRWVEIWNLVFMQFDRSADGKLTPLPKPSVDTGAGLERVSAVMQGVTNNYDIDLFKNLVKAAAALANTSDLTNSSLRVIADHIRACTFLVIDGVTPSNEGRGYVLRRIIRRAIRHGYKLGIKDAFFYKLVDTLAAEMGSAFPELVTGKALAARVLKQEEERFAETLANGMQLLDSAFAIRQGRQDARRRDGLQALRHLRFPGRPHRRHCARARLLHRSRRLRSRDGSAAQAVAGGQQVRHGHVGRHAARRQDGLPRLRGDDGRRHRGRAAQGRRGGAIANAGDEGEVVLDRTPFYAESGGQVGDAGELGNVSAKFTVADTQKRGAAHSHIGKLTAGIIKIGDKLAANVDAAAPQGRDGQPFGHSSITCRAAQGAGHARAAEGLARGAGPPALRLLAFPGDHAR